jgi:exoribonuclease R
MTNSDPHNEPSKKQMKLLRELADETGMTFSWPQSGGEARRAIDGLLKAKRSSRAERRRETRALRHDMAERRGGAASVRDDELRGYGSSAGWG